MWRQVDSFGGRAPVRHVIGACLQALQTGRGSRGAGVGTMLFGQAPTRYGMKEVAGSRI